MPPRLRLRQISTLLGFASLTCLPLQAFSQQSEFSPPAGSPGPQPPQVAYDVIGGPTAQPGAPLTPVKPVQTPTVPAILAPQAPQAPPQSPPQSDFAPAQSMVGDKTPASALTPVAPATPSAVAPATPAPPATQNDNMVTMSSAVQVSIGAPAEVNVHEATDVKIMVKNTSEANLGATMLSVKLPATAELLSSQPDSTSTEPGYMTFDVSGLAANESREISLRVVPTSKTPLAFETELQILNKQTVGVAVRQPELTLEVSGPQQAVIGDTTTHTITIRNTGDGVAKMVKLEGKFPEELAFVAQQGMDAPRSLPPGQAMVVEVKSLAKLPGMTKLDFSAAGTDVSTGSVTRDIKILQPELKVLATGPNRNFVDRDGIYTIHVDNSGEVDVADVKVVLDIPAGMKVTTINRPADLDADSGSLTWKFDGIKAASSETIQLKATALAAGEQVCRIVVSSDQTREKEFQLATVIDTRADLRIQMANHSGPVQVGAQAKFSVNMENQGSSSAEEIQVVVALPPTMLPVRQDHVIVDEAANTVTFKHAQLAAGESQVYEFQAIGVAQGEHVVRGTLQAAGSNRKLIVEDSVFVYETNEARVSENLSPVLPR